MGCCSALSSWVVLGPVSTLRQRSAKGQGPGAGIGFRRSPHRVTTAIRFVDAAAQQRALYRLGTDSPATAHARVHNDLVAYSPIPVKGSRGVQGPGGKRRAAFACALRRHRSSCVNSQFSTDSDTSEKANSYGTALKPY